MQTAKNVQLWITIGLHQCDLYDGIEFLKLKGILNEKKS